MLPFCVACYATADQQSANENLEDFCSASKFRYKVIKNNNGENEYAASLQPPFILVLEDAYVCYAASLSSFLDELLCSLWKYIYI